MRLSGARRGTMTVLQPQGLASDADPAAACLAGAGRVRRRPNHDLPARQSDVRPKRAARGTARVAHTAVIPAMNSRVRPCCPVHGHREAERCPGNPFLSVPSRALVRDGNVQPVVLAIARDALRIAQAQPGQAFARPSMRSPGLVTRRMLPAAACRPAARPTLGQAPVPRRLRRQCPEPPACVPVRADGPWSSVPCMTGRPCSTSGCRRTPGRHQAPARQAGARCRTWSTGPPPAAGANRAARPPTVPAAPDED